MYEQLKKVFLRCVDMFHSRERKRILLSQRLHCVFIMDALEGQLDCLARSVKR